MQDAGSLSWILLNPSPIDIGVIASSAPFSIASLNSCAGSSESSLMLCYFLPRPSARFARALLSLERLEDRTLLSSSNIPDFLLLDPSSKGALTVAGPGSLLATGGSIVVINSANAQAAVASGMGTVSAAEFDMVGNPGFVATGSGKFLGVIHSGVKAAADPLANLPVPPPPQNTYSAVNYSGTAPLTLSPGTYVGGITVSGQGSVTLLPGLYYLKGGGFSVSGQASVSGNGVTIYNDGGGSINFSSSGTLRLTPSTGGTYQDITLFQARSSTAPINLSNTGAMTLGGTVYAPAAKLNITGNLSLTAPATASTITEYIVYDLNVAGNGGVAADASYNQPLTLTASVSPAPKFLPNGTPITNVTQSFITGTTKPGAQIDLETGSDGLFDDGHTTADASGKYSLTVTLSEGLNVFQVRATSRFDQQVIASTKVILDTVPPTITGSRSPAANANGWNKTNVVVSFSASDNLGVASVTAPVTLSSEGANQAVTGTATDYAGNSASTTVGGINIDKTPPVTAATLAGPAGSSGWYRGAVTVTLAATDNLSGVQTIYYALDGGATQIYGSPIAVSGDGIHTLSYWSLDYAGNQETAHMQTIQIDTQPPTLTIASPTSGLLTNQNVTVTGQLTDADSGVAALTAQVDKGSVTNVSFNSQTGGFSFTTSLPLDNTADGPHTIHLTGTDVAGNAVTDSLPFTLDTIPPATPIFDLSSASVTLDSISVPHQTSAARVTLVGHTDPNVTVPLLTTGATVLSSNTGIFQFPGVMLALGSNSFTVQAQDAAGNTSSYSLTITRIASTRQPNAVIVWNQATLNAIETDGTDPLMASRALAMVQSAVYDAVNNVEGTPAYYVKITAPSDSSVDAAVDAAAHDVLGYLYPAQQATFDALLASQLALLPTGQGTTDGETVGQAVGNAIIALRANDGAKTFVEFTPGTAVGDWQPTPPSYAPALDPQGGNMTPWAMTSDSQFDPAGPPALTSQQWADAVNQVESLGSVNSTTRTAAQTNLAEFWNDGVGTYTPAGHWNQIAQTVSQQEGDSLADDARLFAELDVSMADAGIATWNTKYLYDAWRPITVIQSGGDGVNPNVTADPTWTSLLTNPNFPEYVSGHSAFSMAAATVLGSFFGDNVTFTATEQTTNLSLTYNSFDQAAQDAGMSRLYGGIHFLFSIQDGWTLGQEVANFDLATFSVSHETTPPKVNLNSVLPSGASNTNVTITGQATDNLSGVANLKVQVDGGAYAPLSFDPTTGDFSFTTSFALDGSADGKHTINFQATNSVGIVAASVPFTFTLDTQAPTLTITSPTDGGTLTAGATLAGTVTTDGAALVALSYSFDGSTRMPIIFNPDGSFSQALDLSKLTAGAPTLVVTAQDAAGNIASQTLDLSLPEAIPLTLVSITPAAGSSDVGVTVRPKVTFSRPIDTTTLNSDNFYATDTTGTKLAATIVPSDDGIYAWLFFTNPMPAASTITVTVDGSTIKAADGSLLDAAGNGSPGSRLTTSFTTVNEVDVAGTTLSGILADPGPDLQPGTRDDVRVGPSGVLGAADTVYLRPIEGVEVYILGQEDQAVYTNAQGQFSFSSVPTGDVKLAVVGNVPGVMVYDPTLQQLVDSSSEGFYFPSMVMDLTIRPGVTNTVMGSMGTPQEEAANATDLGVYLPRIQTSILQTVSNTEPTMVSVPAQAAPDLTPQQRQYLTLDVQPNSAIGDDGQKMDNVQVGISTVPTVLIKDMLPTGVQQPLITITVQAPGVATFSTPIAVSFPNVYDDAPGTKLAFISFDHTTGRLELEGTATVSADGLSVVTDPGVGVTHPGWHFVISGSFFEDPVNNYAKVGSKADYANPTELSAEYPNSTANLATLTAAEASAEVSLNAVLATFQVPYPTAAQLLGHFLSNTGGGGLESTPDITYPDGSQASNELMVDPNFINENQQVQQRLKQAIEDQLPSGIVDFTVALDETDADVFNTSGYVNDLHLAFGKFQGVTLTGQGDLGGPNDTVATGTLTYTYSIIYGFGTDDLTNPNRLLPNRFLAAQARLLQLAGLAKPFVAAVQVTVPFSFDLNSDPTVGILPTPTISKVPGFGTDPSVYYRFLFNNGFEVAGKTNSLGQISNLVLPANTQYRAVFYAPSTNHWTSIIGTTGASGEVFGVESAPSTLDLTEFGGVDSTGDGLPDIARFVLGLKVGVRSFAGDGIDDVTKLDMGLDPASGISFPTGVIATLPLPGGADEVAVAGDNIYAITKTGLAIVDGSQFDNPILLSQISLTGNPTDVDVDQNLQIAAVATGNTLQLINVSDPKTPTLLWSVPVSATRVVVSDGVAYATSGTTFSEVDLLTGDVLQTLTLPGSGTVTGLAREGTMLYAYVQGSGTFCTIDISNDGAAVVLGHLNVTIASFDVGVFVGNGIAWLAGSGLHTINVSNPSNPTLIHGADITFTAQRIALNGSGLGVLSPDGNSFVAVYDTSNPNVTANQLLQIPLSGGANDVAISRGIAYVADSAGLDVVDYLPFDTNGIPPTASISLPASAIVGTGTDGNSEVVEGSTLPILTTANSDVQVSNVELLVNGQVVENSVSFPFNLSAILPSIAQAGPTITIQVLAFDTGGNVGASNVLTLDLVPDTTPPALVSLSPAAGSSVPEGAQTIMAAFSKPLASATVTAANFQLEDANGNAFTPSVIELRDGGRIVELSYAPLVAGNYQLVINAPAVTDTAGNALGTASIIDSYTLTPRETLTINNANAAPTQPGFSLYEGVTVTGSVSVNSSVAVQSVALLLNGQIISTSSTAPLNFSFIAPLLSTGASSFTLQAQVTDTSGFVTMTAPFVVNLLKDTTPPTIVGINPTSGSNAFQGLETITITFSKPIAESSVTASNFQLFEAGPSGVPGNPDEISIPITGLQFLTDDTQIQLTVAPLQAGLYQLTITEAGITDRPGNPLGTGTYTDQFTAVATKGVILVADNSSNSVTVIDATTDAVRGSVSIPNLGAVGDVAVTADGQLGFVTNGGGQVWVIDLSTTVPHLASGTNPIPIANLGEDISITPDQQYLVVSDGSALQPLSVVDIATRTQVSTFSTGSDSNSVQVLSNDSVLVTSDNSSWVKLLTLNSSGQLQYTGTVLNLGFTGPNNVYGAPGDNAGIVVNRNGTIESFTLPDLTVVSSRTVTGGAALCGVFSPTGNMFYVRESNGLVDAFTFNTTTGALGATPLFSIVVSPAITFFGMDQMAISPDGTLLYVPQANAMKIYNAGTGALVTTITAPTIVSPTGVAVSEGQPQFFAGTAKVPPPDISNLTQAQLQPVIATAIADLAVGGYNVKSLGHVVFQLTNLPDSLLGLTYRHTIWIDQNAQGYGWYTDVSANSSAAFTKVTGANQMLAMPGSPAYGHVDLLTVVTHELGHVLGFASIDPSILGNDWMTATLGTGVRRYPDAVGGSTSPSALTGSSDARLIGSDLSPAGETKNPGSSLHALTFQLGTSTGQTEYSQPAPASQLAYSKRATFALTRLGANAETDLPGPAAGLSETFLQALLGGAVLDLPLSGGPLGNAFSHVGDQIAALMSPRARKPFDFGWWEAAFGPRADPRQQGDGTAMLDSVFSSPEWIEELRANLQSYRYEAP